MAFKTLTDEFSIRTGAVRLNDLGYLIAGDDELDKQEDDHTVIFEWDSTSNGWGSHTVDWVAIAACVCDDPKEQLVAIGQFGQFLVFGQREEYEGVIPAKATPSGEPAPFRGANAIAGKAYAVGMNSQIFRRDGRTSWTALDKGLEPGIKLEGIDGFASNDLYAVGWNGNLWHYNGRKWTSLDSPTNTILTGVCCAGNGEVFVCGRNGTLFHGINDQWEIIEHNTTEEDFWDIKWFDGKLFVSTTSFVYNLSKKRLQLVKFGCDAPRTCCHLSTRDGVLWSIGQRDVMSFDGKKWSRIT